MLYTIPEKLVYALHLHITTYFEGELHLRGRLIPRGSGLYECFETHLMSPIVNKGEKLYDSSSFAFGGERCEGVKIGKISSL